VHRRLRHICYKLARKGNPTNKASRMIKASRMSKIYLPISEKIPQKERIQQHKWQAKSNKVVGM